MDKSNNSDNKMILNNENYNNQQSKIIQTKYENEKQEDNEIIIELEIDNEIDNDKKSDYFDDEIFYYFYNEKANDEKEKEINILCDKEQLINDIKVSEDYYKKMNINPPKEFNYFNKKNTKLYLNDKEIEFNYKLKLKKIKGNKIKIKSNIKLFTLSTMFYNCRNIKNIKFIKFNTNNVTDMSHMFSYCENLSKLNLSSFNTNNVTKMSGMFSYCENLSELNLSSFNTNKVTDMSFMFYGCQNLSELNLSSFNINNVTNMNGMFCSCENLSELNYHHLILIMLLI